MTDQNLPIPNEDPACGCFLWTPHKTVPDEFALLSFRNFDTLSLRVEQLAIDPACPHHGPVIETLRACGVSSYSLSP